MTQDIDLNMMTTDKMNMHELKDELEIPLTMSLSEYWAKLL